MKTSAGPARLGARQRSRQTIAKGVSLKTYLHHLLGTTYVQNNIKMARASEFFIGSLYMYIGLALMHALLVHLLFAPVVSVGPQDCSVRNIFPTRAPPSDVGFGVRRQMRDTNGTHFLPQKTKKKDPSVFVVFCVL